MSNSKQDNSITEKVDQFLQDRDAAKAAGGFVTMNEDLATKIEMADEMADRIATKRDIDRMIDTDQLDDLAWYLTQEVQENDGKEKHKIIEYALKQVQINSRKVKL